MERFIFVKLSFLFILSFLLTSCTYTGVAMTGAQALYDHHNLQKKISNHYATLKAYREMRLKNDAFKDTNLSISSFNNVMLITGQAPQAWQKHEIGKLVKKIADDREVYNFAEVTNPISILTELSDAWITTKIKAQYVAADEIDPNLIKVITENGTVYLMGIIPHDEADVAVQIAKETRGVQSVIKLFSYVTVSKT